MDVVIMVMVSSYIYFHFIKDNIIEHNELGNNYNEIYIIET